MGATDLDQRGKFVWINSEQEVPQGAAAWAAGGKPSGADDEEDQDDRRCLMAQADGKWAAEKCESEAFYICQYDPLTSR